MNNSLWSQTSLNKPTRALNENIKTDILIIGGGITGLSCAYQLSELNKKITLVEANEIGSGITSKTTGKITYLQGNYSEINKKCGYDICKQYYESQITAIKTITGIIKNNSIECNLEESDSYLFTLESDKISTLKEEYLLLKKMQAPIELVNHPKSKYTIKGNKNYTFHPLKYLIELKELLIRKNIPIFEYSRVLSIKKQDSYYICKVNNKEIKTKKVIIASHYPYFLLPYMMPLKVTLEKSYILAKKYEKFTFNAINIDDTIISLRNYTDKNNSYKIFLYGSHSLALKTNIKENFKKLQEKVQDYDYIWSNIDIITGDKIPLIGEIAKDFFIATGYNTWGMTNSTLASLIVKDLILEKENKYKEMTSPIRNSGSSIIKALFASLKTFSEELFFNNKDWYDGRITREKRNNTEVFVYKDDKGKEHIVKTKCPHLKCGLIFNEIEQTWDCPCHGSRFDIDGHCIEGPSNYNITYSPKDR